MAVNWKEDANNNPYVVVKRVGPVNYSIKNSQGKQKIFHRNMIVPALTRSRPRSIYGPGIQSYILRNL